VGLNEMTFDIPKSAETSRSCQQFSSTVTLATHAVVDVVQTLCTDLQSQLWLSSKIHQLVIVTIVTAMQHDLVCNLEKL